MAGDSVIFGCGDVGLRLKRLLVNSDASPSAKIFAVNRSSEKYQDAVGVAVDLDRAPADWAVDVSFCREAQLYYLVPPPTKGDVDLRSRALLEQFRQAQTVPEKVVLISTTGVYGDCGGDWIDESQPTRPASARAIRRLDSEQCWQSSASHLGFELVILRVPGIYANSRIPRERLARRQPLVRSSECGYSNRIHADDLAFCMVAAMQRAASGEVLNVCDGSPSTITDYLQAAAATIGLQRLPEISMRQAKSELSVQMLSYLAESRRIRNGRMLEKLKVTLRYPDFVKGLKYG